jgi:DNA-binding LacI/PurR family transcriptional regulator
MVVQNSKSVNIISIAEDLGISKTTVGYVLSGQARRRRVAEKTAKRVLDAAERLGYVPHLWARNLARQRTGVIGMVIGGFEYNWAADVYDAILPTLENRGYLPMTSIHMWDPKRCESELKVTLERRDEGVISQPLPQCQYIYEQFNDANIPLVFISDTLKELPEANYVAWDCAPAARKAVQYLIGTGRKRIGFIGSSLIQLQLVVSRFYAYKQALIDAGLTFDQKIVKWAASPALVRQDWTHDQESLETATEDLEIQLLLRDFIRSNKIDALFFPHDSLALRVYKVLQKMDIKVPDDVALMGMGDVPLAGNFGVGLSTIREPLFEIGQAAAETLLELIEEPRVGTIQKLIPGNDLKIRRTT